MLVPNFLLGSLALGLTAASALPEAKLTALHGRQSEAGGCDNSQDRTQWCGKGTIKTDGEATWPNKDTPAAAATKTFNIEVAEATLAPDGIQKPMLVINGTYPGPTIIAGMPLHPKHFQTTLLTMHRLGRCSYYQCEKQHERQRVRSRFHFMCVLLD